MIELITLYDGITMPSAGLSRQVPCSQSSSATPNSATTARNSLR